MLSTSALQNEITPKERQEILKHSLTDFSVLIVDDEENVVKSLKRLFRKEEFKLYTAHDAYEALDIIKNNSIDLILSDYKMPGMNGLKLLTHIKTKHPQIIRMMLSGFVDMERILLSIREGVLYQFILKPWEDDSLRLALRIALMKHKSEKAVLEKNIGENKGKFEQNTLASQMINRNHVLIALIGAGLINKAQGLKVYQRFKNNNTSVLREILELNLVNEVDIDNFYAQSCGYKQKAISDYEVANDKLPIFTKDYCSRNLILPLKLQNKQLTLGVADPLDIGIINDIQLSHKLHVDIVWLSPFKLLNYFKEN